MAETSHEKAGADAAVRITNPAGRSAIVLICEHASNRIPEKLGTLGLGASDLQRHIAWDPGALPVARMLADRLDAVLIESAVSRLVIDCNRPLDAPDLITERSELTDIPGNKGLDDEQRAERIALSWTPFHRTVEGVLDERITDGAPTAVVSIHSYNPTWKGAERPWHAGIIHDDDERMSAPIIERLRAQSGLVIGDNEPYAPADRVYHTIERHARSRGLPCAMIEIRNDEIADAAGQRRWNDLLAEILSDESLAGHGAAETAGRKTGENMSHRRVTA
jgi:predicted N-formylglutamate amidohydrolase